MARFWAELRADPRLGGMLALAPNRDLQLTDVTWLLPVVMTKLRATADQVELLDAAARAYARAAGLHFTED